ncbi:hypothetical protein ACFVYE_47070 [Streptomyces sp. NPDC058239]|uniref:hypothetical protein n=1 Tax=Streptomyces sp. NPDC058239 TaxID=3346395 RepID=UPI0036EAFE0C
MSDVEQLLQQWAAQASDEDLGAGPTYADLGGKPAVVREAAAIALGPQLPYLLQAMAKDTAGASGLEHDGLVAAAIRGLSKPYAAWVLSDALDVLCSSPVLLDELGKQAGRVLATHAEDALSGTAGPAFAQPAVAGLLRLCVAGKSSPHRLLLLLTEITGQEPAEALERLPLLIGITHDHYPDDGLLEVLCVLENHADLASGSQADAGFELAVGELRRALEAVDHAEVEACMRRALLRFTELDRTQEARLDARAYAEALGCVLAFAVPPVGKAAAPSRSEVEAGAARLEEAVAQLSAWRGRMHELSWLSARGLSQSAWSRLVDGLRTAALHLDQPSWYSPATALNDLLQVYQASRSVHTSMTSSASEGHGLALLIPPAVEAPFLRREGLLHHLEQALAGDPAFTSHPDARALLAAVQQRRNQTASSQDVLPGKALDGRPGLSILFGSALAPDGLDPALLDRIESLIQQADRGYTPTGNARVDGKLESLLAVLEGSPAWQVPDSTYYTVLLEHFLRFLHDRFDGQADLYGDRTAYLGPAPDKDDGSTGTWPEKAVQDDIHQHLSGVLTPGTVQREVVDVASGRTDVTYTPQPGRRFVIEVKRRKTKAPPNLVERDYLAQAANYTATGPPFGMLLVGDHSNHQAGYSDFDDRVWITSYARSATEVPRLIVIGVLPIGRPTPSALRRPTS